jgi:predicted HTH transcriptional regulator
MLENPGSLRIRVEEAISGGFSNPRNAVLMKMFNLLDIGERAGSGIPNIYHVWDTQQLGMPKLTEKLEEIERVCLTLPLQKPPIKTADKKPPIKTADKLDTQGTAKQKASIIELAKSNETIRSADIVIALGIKDNRAKTLLRNLVSEGRLLSEGGNRNRVYRLPKK